MLQNTAKHNNYDQLLKVKVDSKAIVKFYETDSIDNEIVEKEKSASSSYPILNYIQDFIPTTDHIEDMVSESITSDECDNSNVGRLDYEDEEALMTLQQGSSIPCEYVDSVFKLRGGEEPSTSIILGTDHDVSSRLVAYVAGKNIARWWRSIAGDTSPIRMRFWINFAAVLTALVFYLTIWYIDELYSIYDGLDHINIHGERMGIYNSNKTDI